jgi:hypothetical protein
MFPDRLKKYQSTADHCLSPNKMMTRTLTFQQETVDFLTVTRREEFLMRGKYCLSVFIIRKINASKLEMGLMQSSLSQNVSLFS